MIDLISWTKSVCFSRKFILKYGKSNAFHPTIAQLAERETVEAKQLSLGHWFESGWSEIFVSFLPLDGTKCLQCHLDHSSSRLINMMTDRFWGFGQGAGLSKSS